MLMRVVYSLSRQAYEKLQPPFQPIGPVDRGLFFFLYLVVIEVGVGLAMLSQDLYSLVRKSATPDWVMSAEIFGVGTFLLLGVWGARKLSARQSTKEHFEFLGDTYSRLHCRDRRFVETNEDGLTFGCDCGTQLDKWPGFLGASETDREFMLWTQRNFAIIPKDAFGTEAERTQFRAILSEHVESGAVALSRSVEFCANSRDWRRANWLLFKRGGWMRSGRLLIGAFCLTIIIAFVVGVFRPDEAWSVPSVAGALVFSLACAYFLNPLRHGINGLRTSMKVNFAEDAIYARSDTFVLRIPWVTISWWQCDSKILLFCYQRKSILLIPLRAMQASQLKYILETILARRL